MSDLEKLADAFYSAKHAYELFCDLNAKQKRMIQDQVQTDLMRQRLISARNRAEDIYFAALKAESAREQVRA